MNEEKFKVVLWHEAMQRIIYEPSKEMSEQEIADAAEYFRAQAVPNLSYRKKSEVPVTHRR